MILSPGSSLGGARPKSNVYDTNNHLWIAKFPSKKDTCDIGAWEMVAHDLACLSGLNVPEAKCQRFSKYGSTFLVKRFDRTNDKKRIHFISAMTLLGKTDGVSGVDGVSYLEIADAIRQNCIDVYTNLKQMWCRIAFNILIHNTDDHLRNHGFILTEKGLTLSPLFDVNPNPEGIGLSLNIDENDNSLDLDLLINVSPYFELSEDEGVKIICQIKKVIEDWKEVAKKYHISSKEISEYEPAFNIK